MRRRGAALALAAVLAAGIAGAAGAQESGGNTGADSAGADSAMWRYTRDVCASIFGVAARNPQAACDCMTPILMQRLTPEARAKLADDPDRLPFGVTLFRPATDDERAAQQACMD
jgi:hypothetical protein